MRKSMTETVDAKQRLHLVFGGELTTLTDVQFRDLSNLDIVGIYPDYATALSAWKSSTTIDTACLPHWRTC